MPASANAYPPALRRSHRPRSQSSSQMEEHNHHEMLRMDRTLRPALSLPPHSVLHLPPDAQTPPQLSSSLGSQPGPGLASQAGMPRGPEGLRASGQRVTHVSRSYGEQLDRLNVMNAGAVDRQAMENVMQWQQSSQVLGTGAMPDEDVV